MVLRVTHVAAQRSQVEVLKQLLSPTDDMNEHVDVTCEALMCMEEQHANQLVAFASREQRGVWALIRWAQQHMATGTGRSSQATLLSLTSLLPHRLGNALGNSIYQRWGANRAFT